MNALASPTVNQAGVDRSLATALTPGATWTNQQRSLIELGVLGVLGVDLRTSVFNRQPGYDVMIGSAWTGKDRDLALLADIGPIHRLLLYDPQVTKDSFRIVRSLPSLATLETNVLNLDAECLASLRGVTRLASLRFSKLANPQAMSALVGVAKFTRTHKLIESLPKKWGGVHLGW